eukprot:5617190-Pyramimonas_sp.AAC.1
MAFGPSRHRSWAAGQRPLGCLWGSLWRPLGSHLDSVSGCLVSSRGFLGAWSNFGLLGGIR